MTALLTKAFEELSKLSAERQDEIANMLMDVAESDRRLESGEVGLTPRQWAEVKAAMSDDEPYATDEEVEAFFAKYRP